MWQQWNGYNIQANDGATEVVVSVGGVSGSLSFCLLASMGWLWVWSYVLVTLSLAETHGRGWY